MNAVQPALHCLLVEDHMLMAELLTAMLQTSPVVGPIKTARSVCEAKRQIDQLLPDLLILDLALPDGNGQKVALHLLKRHPSPYIILLSAQLQDFCCEPELLPHIHATVEKTAAYKELSHALNQISTSLEQKNEITSISNGFIKMSAREQEVFMLIGTGKKTREIADYLHISSSTVESHRKAIVQHLDASGAELVRLAAIFKYHTDKVSRAGLDHRAS
jgi:DNA-binding NarL/FixJ family response regulator